MSDELILRKVKKTDEMLLFDWANDSETRKWSFNSNKINLTDHKIWFRNKLKSADVLMLILKNKNRSAGLVRFEKYNKEVILNYQISPKERGKGLASKMLKLAIKIKKENWGNIRLLAFTVPENIASIKSLLKAGFVLTNSTNEKKCYEYI